MKKYDYYAIILQKSRKSQIPTEARIRLWQLCYQQARNPCDGINSFTISTAKWIICTRHSLEGAGLQERGKTVVRAHELALLLQLGEIGFSGHAE
jgi:hypothetical protein